jgi:hypothetical protein
MRLNTKTPSPPDKPPSTESKTETKGKGCAPRQARLADCMQHARKLTLAAAVGALAVVLCLGYTALYPQPGLHARAWCGAAMVLAPVAMRRLQLPEHEAALAAAGLAVLASRASAASKDALCMSVFSAGSVHAIALYWLGTAATRPRVAVTCCLAGALLSTSVLTLVLWGEMDAQTTAAVLAAFLALYVASLFMAKLS